MFCVNQDVNSYWKQCSCLYLLIISGFQASQYTLARQQESKEVGWPHNKFSETSRRVRQEPEGRSQQGAAPVLVQQDV